MARKKKKKKIKKEIKKYSLQLSCIKKLHFFKVYTGAGYTSRLGRGKQRCKEYLKAILD